MNDRVVLLGGLAVFRDGREVHELKGRPTCAALLAVLASECRVTRDEAALLLWPDSASTRARHSLSQTVYQLRKTLGRRWILSRGQELRIGEGIEVDTVLVEQALESGDFNRALELSAGRFLEGWHLRDTSTFEEWVERKVVHHRALFREGARRGIARSVEEKNPGARVAIARRWTRVEPALEEANLHLLRGLLEMGDPASALEAHDAYARRLVDLGTVPGPEVVSLVARARKVLAPGPDVPRDAPTGRRRATHRMLVLPFAHAGPAELGHLTDGLTDEVTVRLSRDPRLAVIARPSALSVERSGRTLVEIGRQLGVDSVLEGRARWPSNGSPVEASVSVQHVRVSDRSPLWAGDIEGSPDGLDGYAAAVVRRVRGALGLGARAGEGSERGALPSRGSPAYELCIRGLHHWHRRSQGELREAIDLFVRAIEADPRYAHSYGCLALAYAMMPSFAGLATLDWLPRARQCAQTALELDPDLVEGHLATGIIALAFDLDVEVAGRHFRHVLAREASNAQALVWEAYRLITLGDPTGSRGCIEEARALDPLSVSVQFDSGMVARLQGDEAEAMDRMRRVLVMDPAFVPAAFILGASHFCRGDLKETARAWERIQVFGPAWSTLLSVLADRERAVEVVDRLVALSPQPVHWYATAVLYTLLGEPGRALHWLEAHLRTVRGDPGLLPTAGPGLLLAVRDPLLDPLRSIPRFRTFLRALGHDTA